LILLERVGLAKYIPFFSRCFGYFFFETDLPFGDDVAFEAGFLPFGVTFFAAGLTFGATFFAAGLTFGTTFFAAGLTFEAVFFAGFGDGFPFGDDVAFAAGLDAGFSGAESARVDAAGPGRGAWRLRVAVTGVDAGFVTTGGGSTLSLSTLAASASRVRSPSCQPGVKISSRWRETELARRQRGQNTS